MRLSNDDDNRHHNGYRASDPDCDSGSTGLHKTCKP
jgi:hypothetical protein